MEVEADKFRLQEPARSTAKHQYNADGYPIFAGTFTFSSHVFGHPQMRCDFLVPLKSPNGAPILAATDIVALFPWPGRQWLRSGDEGWHFARHHGFTVFTLNFLNHDQASPDDNLRYYIYPASGSADAWTAALTSVTAMVGAPPVQKIFVWGESAGGSAAQLFASISPGRVEGLIACSGRTFEIDSPYLGPTVILHTTRDRVEQNTALASAMEAQGALPISYAFAPNWMNWSEDYGWAHTVSEKAQRFGLAWLVSLADLRSQSGGALPPMARWDVVDGRRMPIKKACLPAWVELTQKPTIREDTAAGITTISMPSSGTGQRGTIIWIDNRFGIGPEALTAPVQVFSDQGFGVLTISGGSEEAAPGAVLRDRLRATRGLSGPYHLVCIRPRKLEPAFEFGNDAASITCVDPARDALPAQLSASLALQKKTLLCLGPQAEPQPQPDANLKIRKRKDDGNFYTWMKGVVTAVGDHIAQR
ncbi:MAG: hypothetical protein H0W72_01470 [Planctomycetes bacterium]|nr:hypothetical protein [Planctomycetota bacterium]